MARIPLNVDSALRAAFLKTELAYLKSQPRFLAAYDTTKTASGFEHLCQVAEELLKEKDQANPAAQQFRSSIKRDPKNGGSSRK